MPKLSQTPSKAKSSSKTKAKLKNMKPKPKISSKPTSEPTPTPVPSPPIPSTVLAPLCPASVAPTIPTSTGPLSLKPPSHAPVSTSKNTSKTTKIKDTSRKSVKSDNVVIRATTKEDTMVKEAVTQGEYVSTTTDQVKLPPSKLDVLVFAIEVAPLEIVPPISDKPRVEETTLETNIATQEKRVDSTNVMPMVEGEGEKEPMNKEASDGLSFSWTEDEDDNEGEEE
nr:putative uncharacterized protein DDB_G0290521 [Nicotiana tomentosiformis]